MQLALNNFNSSKIQYCNEKIKRKDLMRIIKEDKCM